MLEARAMPALGLPEAAAGPCGIDKINGRRVPLPGETPALVTKERRQ
jgi:hypothetical protein